MNSFHHVRISTFCLVVYLILQGVVQCSEVERRTESIQIDIQLHSNRNDLLRQIDGVCNIFGRSTLILSNRSTDPVFKGTDVTILRASSMSEFVSNLKTLLAGQANVYVLNDVVCVIWDDYEDFHKELIKPLGEVFFCGTGDDLIHDIRKCTGMMICRHIPTDPLTGTILPMPNKHWVTSSFALFDESATSMSLLCGMLQRFHISVRVRKVGGGYGFWPNRHSRRTEGDARLAPASDTSEKLNRFKKLLQKIQEPDSRRTIYRMIREQNAGVQPSCQQYQKLLAHSIQDNRTDPDTVYLRLAYAFCKASSPLSYQFKKSIPIIFTEELGMIEDRLMTKDLLNETFLLWQEALAKSEPAIIQASVPGSCRPISMGWKKKSALLYEKALRAYISSPDTSLTGCDVGQFIDVAPPALAWIVYERDHKSETLLKLLREWRASSESANQTERIDAMIDACQRELDNPRICFTEITPELQEKLDSISKEETEEQNRPERVTYPQ